MKATNIRSIWRLIRPDPLAASVLVGVIGQVYAVAERLEQPAALPRFIGTRPPVLGGAETLFQEVLRLMIEDYRRRYF